MKIKDYIVARDLPDAIALLEREKASARLIAGGTDVIVRARRGFFRDVTLIDITKVAELKGIALQEDGSVRIGATTRLTDIVDSPVLQEHFPIVGEAAAKVSTIQQAEYPDLPWPKMIGMRNVLVHNYFNIDLDIVWQVVENELPSLQEKISRIVGGE